MNLEIKYDDWQVETIYKYFNIWFVQIKLSEMKTIGSPAKDVQM